MVAAPASDGQIIYRGGGGGAEWPASLFGAPRNCSSFCQLRSQCLFGGWTYTCGIRDPYFVKCYNTSGPLPKNGLRVSLDGKRLVSAIYQMQIDDSASCMRIFPYQFSYNDLSVYKFNYIL